MKITKRDREILDFIKQWMFKYSTTPTMKEIGEGVGLYSTNTVYYHFRRLVEAGLIIQDSSSRYTVKGMKFVEE